MVLDDERKIEMQKKIENGEVVEIGYKYNVDGFSKHKIHNNDKQTISSNDLAVQTADCLLKNCGRCNQRTICIMEILNDKKVMDLLEIRLLRILSKCKKIKKSFKEIG